MKKLLECDLSWLGIIVSANLSLSGLADLFNALEPMFRGMLSVGQIAVAVATTWYIIRRTRQLGKEKKK